MVISLLCNICLRLKKFFSTKHFEEFKENVSVQRISSNKNIIGILRFDFDIYCTTNCRNVKENKHKKCDMCAGSVN